MDPSDSFLLDGAQVVPCDHAHNLTAEANALNSSVPSHETLGPFAVLPCSAGLRLVGLESDSDSDSDDEEEVVKEEDDGLLAAPFGANRIEDNLGPSRHWERIGTVEDERVPAAAVAAGEELVDSCPDGLAALGADEDGSVSESRSSQEEDEELSELEYDGVLVTLMPVVLGPGGWYVGDSDADSYIAEGELEHVNAFGQFVDHDRLGNTPTAKSVVERLPVVLMTDAEAAGRNTFCAVCKDEILLAEMARQLPCSHLYHGDCILPWLQIKNTCPLCRHELPTKDSDSEN